MSQVPALRTIYTPLQQCFLVKPDGHIKRALFERNLECPLLIVRWLVDPDTKRRVGIGSITLDPSLEAEGWSMLRDLYAAEDRLEDFAEYVKWSDHANTVPGVKPIDDEYLPDEVLRRKRDHKAAQQAISLKPPKRRKAKDDKTDKDGAK